VLALAGSPFFDHLLGDARGYDRWAQSLAAGDWLGSGVFYQAPLYPYVLGSLYALFGRDLLIVRLIQAGIGALSCGVLTLAAMKWFGPRAAVCSGVLLACYAPALFFDALIQKPVLDGLLVSALLLMLAITRRDPTLTQCALTGASLGLLTLNRENAVILLPLVAFVVARGASNRRPQAVLATVLAMAVVLAPVAIRNLVVGGEVHLTTFQLGPNFYIGNHQDATGTYVPLRPERGSFEFERLDATALAEAATGGPLRPSQVSDYWLRRGLAWIRNNPAGWMRLTGRKLALLLNRTESADTEDLASHGEWSLVLRAAAGVVHFGVLAPLALLGVWITRDRWRDVWPLYAFSVIFAMSVLAFFVLDRYRYPLVPVLTLFAGVAIADAWPWWRKSQARERGATAILVAAAAIACNWPVQSSADIRALTHFNLGVRLHDEGLDAQAEAEYRTALRFQPALASAHGNLGALLTAQGQQAEALAHVTEAVRLAPRSAAAHVNLGIVLANIGKPEEAVRAFSEAIELDPRDAEAHYDLGRALASLARTKAAVEHLREAIRLAPENAGAHNTLGAILCSEGRLDEGVEELRTAVRLDPAFRDAAANLEHAEDLLRNRR